jgi:nucleoside-triphosphatase THEP1
MCHHENQCILWVAARHSGKTTAATELTRCLQQQGWVVGGILAPSVYKDGRLTGFDIIDIKNNLRIPLAYRNEQASDVGPYRYYQEGLDLGRSALSFAENESAKLVIVDEYGPLELSGKGWRCDVDSLLRKGYPPVLLVVRRELADEVRRLYAEYFSFALEALDPKSIDKLLVWLKERDSACRS